MIGHKGDDMQAHEPSEASRRVAEGGARVAFDKDGCV